MINFKDQLANHMSQVIFVVVKDLIIAVKTTKKKELTSFFIKKNSKIRSY